MIKGISLNTFKRPNFTGYTAKNEYINKIQVPEKDTFSKQISAPSIKILAKTHFDYEIFKGKIQNIFFDLNSTNQGYKNQDVGMLEFDETGFYENLRQMAHNKRGAKGISKEFMDDTPIKARFVLNNGTKEEGNKVIKILTNAVKADKIKIKEVRVYRQSEATSYASREEITKLINACTDKFGTCKRVEKQKLTGYHGIHLICELDGGTKGEIQIMGKHTEALKDVEDVLYRLTNNKAVDKKFENVKNAYKKLTDTQKRNLIEYTRNAFLAQRSKEMGLYKSDKFTPIKNNYELPIIFDFNNLAKY